MKITDLPNMEPPPVMQPQPTEKAQIVIGFNVPVQSMVLRFNTVKKAEKAYKALMSDWREVSGDNDVPYFIHSAEADMFNAAIDLRRVISIAYVDHAIRAKFIPV